MQSPQLDLFGETRETDQSDGAGPVAVTEDFVARIRSELLATLQAVREASSLPWSDLTRATLAELRYHSVSRWLPEAEAAELRAAFDSELDRLYGTDQAAAD